eukprot:CAMPEP_0171122390 /NCGR_PEP_ID=MMETSP0766_2-20121228/104907_1 /TAXON_ID=439317 /ORGANISM="Gambierdiscus australes, Strain CAWD 149" /LENGTH=50 /DNA_ID=CAMNT_0011585229 /DNA_START=12 /DNA_END=161 /DNA_ORIENTATION=+
MQLRGLRLRMLLSLGTQNSTVENSSEQALTVHADRFELEVSPNDVAIDLR